MHSIETEFIKNFIKPHRQERWLACLASTNKRSAFLDCLNHCRDFEDQHVRIIRSASQLEEALHRVGGEDECYILSSDPKLDGYWVKLDTAMELVRASGWGTALVFENGSLAYYFDECGERELVLNRERVNKDDEKY